MKSQTAALILFAMGAAHAQTVSSPAFEVASVRPSPSRAGTAAFVAMDTDPGMVRYSNLSLKILISIAYRIDSRRILRGPAWIDDQPFDLTAKLPAGTSKELVPAMLQSLLEERFKLAVHRENRDQQVYFLVVGKNGSALRPSETRQSEPENPNVEQVRGDRPTVSIFKNRIVGRGISVAQLAGALAGPSGREVSDRTGITGNFDVDLKWAMEGSNENGPSLFTAIQEQLGLKLEPGKGPVETLIVDRAERIPSDN
jgi:uncharacterized protein (TIGR03435 family)